MNKLYARDKVSEDPTPWSCDSLGSCIEYATVKCKLVAQLLKTISIVFIKTCKRRNLLIKILYFTLTNVKMFIAGTKGIINRIGE